MRTIKLTAQFIHDYKREEQGQHGTNLDKKLRPTMRLLTTGTAFPERTHDYPLSGDLKDCRYCYIKPDLVLIYRKNKDDTLELIRLGSHNELSI